MPDLAHVHVFVVTPSASKHGEDRGGHLEGSSAEPLTQGKPPGPPHASRPGKYIFEGWGAGLTQRFAAVERDKMHRLQQQHLAATGLTVVERDEVRRIQRQHGAVATTPTKPEEEAIDTVINICLRGCDGECETFGTDCTCKRSTQQTCAKAEDGAHWSEDSFSFKCMNPECKCGKEVHTIEAHQSAAYLCDLLGLPDVEALATSLHLDLDIEGDASGPRRPPSKPPEAEAHAVTDEQAAVFLRRAHQRLGHASLRVLRTLHRSGELLGPSISDDQFECVQFHCPTCQLTRQTRKAFHRRRVNLSKSERVLDKVIVDVVGPRVVPSVYFKGDRGNQTGGGNLFAVFYLDDKTNRVFVDFIKEKSDLEDSVVKMKAHMTEQARYSVDYDGSTDITVKRWESDRDSDLTSDRAVAEMIQSKVEHIMAASGAKNQTPTIDNVIRRCAVRTGRSP